MKQFLGTQEILVDYKTSASALAHLILAMTKDQTYEQDEHFTIEQMLIAFKEGKVWMPFVERHCLGDLNFDWV